MMNKLELLKMLDELDKEFGYYEELENEIFVPSHMMVNVANDIHEEHVQGWM